MKQTHITIENSNFVVPPPELQPYIERIWWKTIDAQTELLPLMPGTGAELVFVLGSSLSTVKGNSFSKVPKVTLFSPHQQMIPLVSTGEEQLISVRIRSGMLHNFLPKEIVQSLPEFIDAEELWPNQLSPLWETLHTPLSLLEKARHIEQFLFSRLKEYSQQNYLIDTLATLLYYKHNSLTVQSAANKMGYSRRQLLRLCLNSFGLSPKQYLSLARFNRVLRQSLLHHTENYLPFALDAGYYDQAHFIHECNEFTGRSPQKILHNVIEMSHFYNTSLKDSSYIAPTFV